MSVNHRESLTRVPVKLATAESLVVNRPIYLDRLPPCNCTCPAGENIQEWLALVQDRRFEEAWRALVKNNPLPAIHGRVCYHPCEDACNRKHLDQPVSIHGVERFLGDLAIEKNWSISPGPQTGRRVLVIGSGPCGLSAAYHLALLGHQVTVYEAGARLGGMMRYGIPEYRLPRLVLDAEIDRIARMGVQFKTNTRVNDLQQIIEHEEYDAVLLAIGAQLGKRVDIPTQDAGRIIDALRFLADAENSAPLCLGRRVAIYGGGNTAMDAARTALRLGAENSIIIYRRDQSRMPAHESEYEEAIAEGVVVNWLRTVKAVTEGEIEVEVMQLDAKGNPQPTGQKETIKADMLILALGQETQSAFLKNVKGISITSDGMIQVDPSFMTGCPGVFAGGDMIPANKTVTTAVGHGKKTARHIDAYLRGGAYVTAPKHTVARFSLLKMDWYSKASQSLQPMMDPIQRIKSFEEIVAGFTQGTASYEADRCLSCGNCFECDTCYNVCPDQTIVKKGAGRGYEIKMENCSRCSLCVQECPCGAMAMVPDTAGVTAPR